MDKQQVDGLAHIHKAVFSWHTIMASHKGHNVLQQHVVKKSQHVVVVTNQNTGFTQHIAKNKLTRCEFTMCCKLILSNALQKSCVLIG